MGRLAFLIVVVGMVIGALMPSDLGQDSQQPTPKTASSEPPTPSFQQAETQLVADGPWTTLQREPNGHFYARAQVNGQSVDFMVDTGASGVALTQADARRIGLHLDPGKHGLVGSGASGPVYGQLVILDRVTLDGKTVEHVSGAVLDGAEISLLGQSFLGRMGNIEISGDRMIIR